MIYNVKPVYDLLDFQIHSGNAYGAVINDAESDYMEVEASGTRIMFVETGNKKAVLDYALLTDSAVTAKLYKDVYLPGVYSAEITVSKGATATGEVGVSLNGGDAVNVAVTAEDTAAAVATAMATAIDTLESYSASASEDVVTVTYAAASYVPLTVGIDPGDTGVETAVEISVGGDLTEGVSFNRDHMSAKTATTAIYCEDGTIDIDDCLHDDSQLMEIMLLNKQNLDAKRVLAPDSVYAILLSNAGEDDVKIIPQLIWHEI
jgi:hypothetical protein